LSFGPFACKVLHTFKFLSKGQRRGAELFLVKGRRRIQTRHCSRCDVISWYNQISMFRLSQIYSWYAGVILWLIIILQLHLVSKVTKNGTDVAH
jgi:hypothetical protein